MGSFWIEDSEDHLTPEGVAAASRLVPAGTVLLLTRGMTLHKRVPICKTAKPTTFNQDVKAVLPKVNISGRFLPYLLIGNHDRLHAKVDSAGHGTGRLSTEAILNFPVHVPQWSKQESIAAFGEALDQRITLLRETNATMEAFSQTLFKSWFVTFDPVRAKSEGREPEGIDKATASLFPASFEETALGLIPKGWSVRKLGDVCTYLNRGLSPKYVDENGVLVINQKCIRDFSVDYTKARRHDPLQRKIDGRSLVIGDVLVNSTGVGTLGRVAQVLALTETTIVDSHVTVLRAGAELSWPYLGLWMNRKQPEIEAMGEGSTGQTELSRSKLAELLILMPSKEALHAFNNCVKPIKQRIAVNEAKAKTLADLRVTLLPRLITGQLGLPEATKAIDHSLASTS